MADTQSSRVSLLQERERWLRSVQVEGREELLFEFEMLLRGVERYFNLHNLPIGFENRPVVTRDFSEELRDVREAIDQAIQIARQLLDPESDQKMVFRRYIESQLADDRQRRELFEDSIDQDTPQESLFLLRQSFESLRSILDHLLKLEVIGFNVYNDVGNLALRDIVLNKFFRPFKPLEFRIEYDRIKSVPILELLRTLPEEERRNCTVAFLGLFRLLHYLSYVDVPEEVDEEEADAVERRGRIVLALVRSETVSLASFLEGDLASKSNLKRVQAAAVKISRELSRQSQQIVKELLAEDGREGASVMKAAVALTEEIRKNIVLLARTVAKAPESAMTFESLVNPSFLAERLRNDLWIFTELSREVAKALTSDEANGDAALEKLRRFLLYFQEVSYQLLRYADYESVDRFTAMLFEFDRAPVGPAGRARFAEDCRLFAQICQTTFVQVNRRAVLSGRKFDLKAAREQLTSSAFGAVS
ncbi:MAG: hypothetical protein ACJ790_10510 [Myxococcaceae bacterium]